MIKNIVGFEGLYVINDSDNDDETVFSIRLNDFIKPYTDHKGYKRFNLCKDGVTKTFSLHRLKAEAFIPNPDNKPCIDHIVPIRNGGTNELSNLRWVTYKENQNNEITLENSRKSQVNNSLKSFKVYQYTKDNVLFKVWPSVGECSRNGYNKGHVAACCRGEQDTHKGFKWSYKEL